MVMDDGYLLAACEVKQAVDEHGKTHFFAHAPYSTPAKTELPPQEEYSYAYHIF